MASWVTAMLVACVASVVSSVAITQVPWTIQEADSIALAIDFYNQQQYETSVFRLLELDHDDKLDESVNLHRLKFRIKETVCPKLEAQNTEECEFKEDGLVKDCSAYVLHEKEFKQKTGAIRITCEPVDQQKTREKRSYRRKKKPRVGWLTVIGHGGKKNNNRIIWAK